MQLLLPLLRGCFHRNFLRESLGNARNIITSRISRGLIVVRVSFRARLLSRETRTRCRVDTPTDRRFCVVVISRCAMSNYAKHSETPSHIARNAIGLGADAPCRPRVFEPDSGGIRWARTSQSRHSMYIFFSLFYYAHIFAESENQMLLFQESQFKLRW